MGEACEGSSGMAPVKPGISCCLLFAKASWAEPYKRSADRPRFPYSGGGAEGFFLG